MDGGLYICRKVTLSYFNVLRRVRKNAFSFDRIGNEMEIEIGSFNPQDIFVKHELMIRIVYVRVAFKQRFHSCGLLSQV